MSLAPLLASTAMPVTGRSASWAWSVFPRLFRATTGSQESPRLVVLETMMLGLLPRPPSWASQPVRAMYRPPLRPNATWSSNVPRALELQLGYHDGDGELLPR